MAPSNSVILRCSKLSKIVQASDGPITILENASLEVAQGTTIAIIGQSGSGKTTLLSLLAGLDTPTDGEIQLFQHNMHAMNEDQRARVRNENIGFVFQAFHLLPGFTALENVMLPLEINNVSSAQSQAAELLQRVGMQHRLHHYPTTLSGGEQQRVAIARAFATNPPVLFADEPTGNLDTDTGNRVIELLFELNREFNTTLILVTHDEKLSHQCKIKYRLSEGALHII